MQGSVIFYNKSTQTGIILSNDSARFNFNKASGWMSDGLPRVNDLVDFKADTEGKATQICRLNARRTSLKSRGAAMAWAFFLGWLGAHKFYLGKPWQGVFYFLFSWTGLSLLAALIDFLILAFSDDDAFQEKYS